MSINTDDSGGFDSISDILESPERFKAPSWAELSEKL